jgi:hypothetical protein
MSCVTLRGRWCDIVFPNVHVWTVRKWWQDRFLEKLEGLFEPHENIVIKFESKSMERRHIQNNNQEWEFSWNW